MPSSYPAPTSDGHSPWSHWDLLPPLPEPPESPRGFRVRLSLDETKPPVWRRLIVPGDMTLDQFHAVVQETMGWYDCHLHQFWMGPRGRQRVFLTDWDLSEGEEGIAESDVRLDQVLRQKGDKLRYDYDFGDGWRHTILVEEVLEEEMSGPSCTAGRRACPPEDCGGVYGYEEIVRWVEAGRPTAFESDFVEPGIMAQWLEEDWDPNHFDAADINERLALLERSPLSLNPELAELVSGVGFGQEGMIDSLLLHPGWYQETVEPDSDTIRRMVEPFHQMLTFLGKEGVELTAQGYLKPAAVREIAEITGVASWWIGKLNRESQTYPVSALHESLKQLKLARKYRGRLLPTKKGLLASEDPNLIWQAAIDALPLGTSKFDRHAGWLTLLTVGADAPVELWHTLLANLLSSVGWSADGHPLKFWEVSNPTLEILTLLADGLRRADEEPSQEQLAAVAVLARAAVRGAPASL